MTPMEQIECGNASGISLPEAFLYSLLTPTQVLRRLIVVEDVNQQAPAVFYNADVTVEAGVRDGVHASLHHNLTEGEVHHVSCLSLQRFLRGVHRHCGREAIGAVAQCQATVRGDTVLLHRVGVGSVDGCLTICGCCGFGSRLWRRGRLRSIFRRWGAVLIAAGLGRDGGRGDVLRGCRFCDRLRVLGDLWNILLLSPFLHDSLAACITVTKQYLSGDLGAIDADVVLREWEKSIVFQDAGLLSAREKLYESADSSGVTIRMRGTEPAGGAAELMYTAMQVCLSNAIQYAQATELVTNIWEDGDRYTVLIRNNGRPPEKTITEGGGLSNLRRRIERIGGTMTVQSLPEFALVIGIPTFEKLGDNKWLSETY